MSNAQLLEQPASRVIELDIEGMTCASCVGRVERKLGKLEGVRALVNLPLESAQVTVPANITDDQITATVNAAGYKATVRTVRARGAAEAPAGSAAATLKPRLVLAAALTIPVFVLSMLPAVQFPHWGWVAAALALPVVSWAAWPFHRAAAVNARHLASTMDTRVSIGVTAAYVFSAWQLLADPRLTGHPGMEGMDSGGLYFEVSAVVTTFLLLGRYLEANAKQKAGRRSSSTANGATRTRASARSRRTG